MPKMLLSELYGLTAVEKKAQIDAFVNAKDAHEPGSLAKYRKSLEDRCKQFEQRSGMKVETLRKFLDSGEVKETADYCTWLLLEEELSKMRVNA